MSECRQSLAERMAEALAAYFAGVSQVVALALGGSQPSGAMKGRTSTCRGGVHTWTDTPTGIMVDCNYFGADWMEEQVVRVMEAHQPSPGYSPPPISGRCRCHGRSGSHRKGQRLALSG